MSDSGPSITPRRATLTIGLAQTVAYAGSTYLPATLSRPMAEGVGASVPFVFLAYSAAMLLQAFITPWIGRLVDRQGGRPPLAVSSLLFAAGLAGLAVSQTPVQLGLAWVVVGLAMASGLYDIAFAGLVGWFGQDARRSITGVTLIAGFASTVGWPLTAWLEANLGWRGACAFWSAAHLFVAFPLHFSLPRGRAVTPPPASANPGPGSSRADWARMALMAAAFTAMGMVGSAMSAHLPPLLIAVGAAPVAAVAAAALVGPSQVAARLAEFALVRHIHPLVSGRLAIALFPLAAGGLMLLGPVFAAPFAILYGAGNGLFTIVRGALPLAIFGAQGYGRRLGWIGFPGRVAGAAAPFGFALLLEHSTALALGAFAALCLAGLACLGLLRRPIAP